MHQEFEDEFRAWLNDPDTKKLFHCGQYDDHDIAMASSDWCYRWFESRNGKENKWMTREEFESTHNSMYCWVATKEGFIHHAYFYNNEGIVDKYGIEYEYDDYEIKAVMPIEKPEYPK